MMDAVNLAVLVSGYGSNLQAIIDAVESRRLAGVQIVCVVSDRAGAYGLERARRHGIPAVYFPYPPRSEGPGARRARDGRLAELLEQHGTQWVVLAGWLRVLSSEFLHRFPNRVLNLHPALPGQFPGLDAIERAFQAYQAARHSKDRLCHSERSEESYPTEEKMLCVAQHDIVGETGVMVHLVPDEAVDAGPLVASESVPIYPDDTLETLTERVHGVEHRLLVRALSELLTRSK